MKVNVTQKSKTTVILNSLEPGDGFLFDGCPHIVGRASPWDIPNTVVAFDLGRSLVVFFHRYEQVQVTQINVEHTV